MIFMFWQNTHVKSVQSGILKRRFPVTSLTLFVDVSTECFSRHQGKSDLMTTEAFSGKQKVFNFKLVYNREHLVIL